MRLRSRWLLAALIGTASLGAASAALADPPNRGVRIDQLQPASPESPFFRVEAPHNPDAEGVEFAAGLTFEYAHEPLTEKIVDASGAATTTRLVQNAMLARVGASITPLHWLAFDLSLPISLYESGSAPQTVAGETLPAGKGPGVGDLRIGAHFRPIDTAKIGLVLGGRIWAPFGTPQSTYLSDGAFRGEIDVGVAGAVEHALYGCTVNLSPGILVHRAGDRFAAECAGYFKANDVFAVGLEPSLELVAEPQIGLNGASSATKLGVLFEPLVGTRFFLGGFRLGVGLGPGFGGGMGGGDFRALVNAGYVGLGKPPKAAPVGPPDRDLDKIPDDDDACPDEAGPPSKDPKKNGCPTHDRDGDNIPDEQDFCPDRAGIPYPDPNANGCPDSDNDGLPDPVDKCVNEPGSPPTGCPKYARLTGSAFRIDPPIDFGAGEKLTASGRAALQEIAATMRANPKIEQVSISIGTKGAKAATSDKRAQEILLTLRAAELDSSRYEVVLRDDVRAGLVLVRLVK